MIGEQQVQDMNLVGRSFVVQSQKDNTAVTTAFAKNQLAEIAVVRDENPGLLKRSIENLVVGIAG